MQLRTTGKIAVLSALLSAGLFLPNAAGALEINYLTNAPPSSARINTYKILTDELTKTDPAITWRFEQVTSNTQVSTLEIRAASNALPVVFEFPDRTRAKALYASGKVVNYIPILKKLDLMKYLDPFVVERYQLEEGLGKDVLIDLPSSKAIEGFFYNKTIFAKYNLQPPKTWDELLKVCEALKAAGVQPIASVGGDNVWPLTRLIGMYASRKLGNDAVEQVRDGKLTFADPGFIEAAKAVQDLEAKGYLGPSVATTGLATATTLFTNGRAAMMFNSSSSLSTLVGANNPVKAEEIGLFNFPMVAGGKGTGDAWSMGLGAPMLLSTNGYNSDPQKVEKWLSYVLPRYGDLARQSNHPAGLIPQNRDKPAPPLITVVEQAAASAKTGVFQLEQFMSSRAFVGTLEMTTLMVTGQMKPEEYMKSLDGLNKQ